MPTFSKDSNSYATCEKRYDADGKVWMKALVHGTVGTDTLTAKTPYKILYNEYGPVTAALSDVAARFYVGFPEKTEKAGDVAWLQIGGPIDDAVTPSLSLSVGHGLTIDTGAIANIGADYSGAAGEFAVARTATTTSTTQDLWLVPERVLSIT